MTTKAFGIYEIVNKLNNKRYIGNTMQDFKVRWSQHKSLLNKNKHHSEHLQFSWNKHGTDNFEFKIVEVLKTKEECVQREQYYIDFYNSYNAEFGYNMCPTAGSPAGRKLSEEHKHKIGLASKGKTISEEQKLAISKANKGKRMPEHVRQKLAEANLNKVFSEEQRKRISEATKGEKNPFYGKKHTEETIKKLRDINLGRKHTEETLLKMKNRYIDKPSPNKGKPMKEETKKKLSQSRLKYKYKVTSPDNVELIVNNLMDFCKEHNLCNGNMYAVANGKIKQCKGWRVEKIK